MYAKDTRQGMLVRVPGDMALWFVLGKIASPKTGSLVVLRIVGGHELREVRLDRELELYSGELTHAERLNRELCSYVAVLNSGAGAFLADLFHPNPTEAINA